MALWLLGADARAADSVFFEPAPTWVKQEPVPEISESNLPSAVDGIHYLLLGTQVKIGAESYDYYRRSIRRVINSAGLEDAARLQFSFDPTEERFQVHSIRIIRDGVAFNRLDPDSFSVFQREPDLAGGVTDGRLTAYYELTDVRVGDTVDYEVSWTTASDIWPGEFATSFAVEWSVPLEVFHQRILTTPDKPLTIRHAADDIEPVVVQHDGETEYIWRSVNPAPIAELELVPVDFPHWGSVSVSTLSSWAEVVSSLERHYNSAWQFPDGFVSSKDWLTKGASNEKITAAIRFVQDEIRYVADENGVGSHLPRSPATTIGRGWGDCKDKSTLLVALLRHLGIEAYVALTDNDSGYALPLGAPSPFAFDHAIVVIIIDGKRHWIDATQTHQGGAFPNIAQPVYGFGLPLFADSAELWSIEVNLPTEPEKSVSETFDFAKLAEEGMTLTVLSTYSGREADAFRYSLASSSVTKIASDYHNYYLSDFPGLQRGGDVLIDDDRNANVIQTTEHYVLTEENFRADNLQNEFIVRSDAVRNVLSEPVNRDRDAPVALPFPKNLAHEITIQNTGFKMGGIEGFEAQEPEFSYSRKAQEKGDAVTIKFHLATKARQAPLSQFARYVEIADQANDFGVLEYNLDASAETEVTTDEIVLLAVILFYFLSLGAAVWGAVKAIEKDNKSIEYSVFYPVSIAKFTVLNVATFGVYAVFWMYRCWRWLKRANQDDTKPFWRAFFSWLWFWPLFSAIRDESRDSFHPPTWLGGILALLYGVWYVVFNGVSAFAEPEAVESLALSVVGGLFFIFAVPLVVWVNKANSAENGILTANSRWSFLTWIAVMFGVSNWALLAVIAYSGL